MLFFVFFLSIHTVFSQINIDGYKPNFIPSSPNASALGKYGDIPVSYATGIPSISIPLFNVSSKQLSLPVSINYHSGGNKVDEIASNVGLGWSLNAGGVITRTVMGKPDDGDLGFAKNGFYIGNNSHLASAAKGNFDTEPDIFYFNVAGYTGKFYIDTIINGNYTIRLIPYQDVLITRIGDDWKMTDPNGVEYLFSEKESTQTETLCNGNDAIQPLAVTSWYLKTITHPAGDVITLSYESESYSYTQSNTESLFIGSSTTTCPLTNKGLPSLCYTSINVTNAKRVKSIDYNFGKIVFNYDETRQDLQSGSGNALCSCEMQTLMPNGNYAPIKRFSFTHDYFTSDISSAFTENNKRLKLTGLIEKGIDVYGTETSLPPYSFNYLETGDLCCSPIFGQ